MRRPDLQRLVENFGGYHQVPPETWTNYDAAVAKWHADRRAELQDEQFRNRNGGKPAEKRRKKQ